MLRTTSFDFRENQRIAERYRILRLHNQGRYTAIYLAQDEATDLPRAVKVLTNTPFRQRLQIIQRLQNEARILQNFPHPHILSIFADMTDRNPPCLITEWVPDGSLQQRLMAQGPMPLDQALPIARQILDALTYLHDNGVIHRDIKPDNVLMRTPTHAVLCDFGIAHFPKTDQRLTLTNAAMGSLNYMAPEQRVDASTAGPAADQYAVACTVYQCLTGWNSYNLFMAPRQSPRWSVLRSDLADVLFQATRAVVAARFPSCQAFCEALTACAGGDRPAFVPGDAQDPRIGSPYTRTLPVAGGDHKPG